MGNRRIPRESLRSRLFTHDGDVFNDELLKRDFQALWNTQYFEDIRLEIEDSPDKPNQRVVVFYLKERPTIRRIEYKNLKSASESEVLDRFKERKVGLSVENQFDPTKIKRAEVVLKELLGERGRQFAKITPTYERIPATNAVKLVFNIDEGPKVKVGKITIEGNTAFGESKIIRSMRHSRPYAVPLGITFWNVMSKTYDRRKLSEDIEIGIRGLYQDNGYFKVLVKDPVTETVDINRGGIPGPWPIFGRKHGKATNITIPLQEGDRYHLGRIIVRSSDPDKGLFFKTEFLQNAFPIQPGGLFSVEKVRKALQDYQKLYGQWGFIDFTADPVTDVDTAKKEVTLTLDFNEQKQFFVRRIEFQGNDTTRDKVMRREVLLDEGDLFNNRLWEVSILRLNQLDYFNPIKPEHAEIKRNLKEGSVDILLKVKEKGKQSVGLTGGISGLAGSFIGLNYQTNNLLGRGETLTFSTEFGDRQRNFVFSYTKPFMFDRPLATGFSIFSNRFSYNQSRESSLLVGRRLQLDPNTSLNYNQESKGFTTFASYPIKRFSFTRIGLTYSYTRTSITAFSDASRLLFENLNFRALAGPSALVGIHSSKFQPTINYSTVDSPINPSSGKSFFYAFSFEGGPLGGNVNAFTNIVEAKYFHPINKRRNTLGFRFQTAFATGFGGLNLPPFNRFYTGGEDSIRGFDIRTITPVAFIPLQTTSQVFYLDPTKLDSFGNPRLTLLQVPVLDYSLTFPGGDLQSVGNFEYRVPIVGQYVGMSFYIDMGVTGVLQRDQLALSPVGLTQLRTAFPNDTIKDKLDLAGRSNFHPRSSTGVEFVIQLPIIQAPFRIYWAYNLHRLHEVIQEPRGDFVLGTQILQTLPPGILTSQVLPQLDALVTAQARQINYFEPLKTFRFTVSRTF
ncbi:MAG: outer membrane protein assembly factor BamA [Acidobacteria bacterium]|nr:outer membrane protein assembly factor BamA [Acidobacteriota bacterium]